MTSECKLPPKGWRCTRPAGHEGPCAAIKKDGFWKKLGNAAFEVVANMLYQGPR